MIVRKLHTFLVKRYTMEKNCVLLLLYHLVSRTFAKIIKLRILMSLCDSVIIQ